MAENFNENVDMEAELLEQELYEAPREPTPIEAIVGSNFINNKSEPVKNLNEIFSCKVYFIFFSASWCSPCEIFAKELVELYNEANEGVRNLEIIQVNFDTSESQFRSAISDKPWIFIPINDGKINELKERYELYHVPVLFVYRSDGSLITMDGRKEITDNGINIIDQWLGIV
jgi:nucleoredoxin